MSPLYKLNTNDLLNGLIGAIFSAVVAMALQIVSTPGFDIFTSNWHSILNTMFITVVASLSGYLGRKTLTDQNNSFLGSGVQ